MHLQWCLGGTLVVYGGVFVWLVDFHWFCLHFILSRAMHFHFLIIQATVGECEACILFGLLQRNSVQIFLGAFFPLLIVGILSLVHSEF